MKTQNKKSPKNSKQQKNKATTKNVKKKKNIKLRKAILVLILITIVFAIFIAILLSDIFSIKTITVINNSKISEEEIIEKSKLILGNNMFKILNMKIKSNIKTEPYIENVKIHKKINGEIIINVQERTATYMLQSDNGFAYINNQGYILEMSVEPAQLAIIKGYETEDIIPGKRMVGSDLEKLENVIEIMEAAKSKGIQDKIQVINITDKDNFILEIPTEDKDIEFGDGTNINVKILWIIDLLEKTKGTPGTIVLNVSDIKKVYFREKV